MTTVSNGELEWDEAKATTNLSKHGVSFEEAATVFADPNAVVLDDGSGRGRCWLIGFSDAARLLTVVYFETIDGFSRVLSARRASRSERLLYAER